MDPDDAEAARYAHQLLLPGFGPEGQQLLGAARVHVVGAGPVGGPALLYLAQAGVGTLYVDDGEDVAPGDAGAWLCSPDQVGQPRVLAAVEALRSANPRVRVRAHATGLGVTAALVCAQGEDVARLAAERARLAGVPHVVALASGGGGTVVSVPCGAPCYSCVSRPGAGTLPRVGEAAAIGALGAQELLLLLVRVVQGATSGRRIDVEDGLLRGEATTRKPMCDCRNVYWAQPAAPFR